MEFAVYGMNIKGEIAVLATYESEEKALRGLDLYRSCGGRVFSSRAHWFWMAEVIPGPIHVPTALLDLEESLKNANEYR